MSDIDLKTNEFRNYYHSNPEFYNSAVTLFTKLIEPIVNVEYVSGRIKDYNEYLSKFERKYLPGIETSNAVCKVIDLTCFIVILFRKYDMNIRQIPSC